jgi:hypothetical protein
MYPHVIDRLRLLQFIFGRLQKASMTQHGLANITGLSQSSIAALCNRVDAYGDLAPTTKNTRRNLLTTGHALGLTHSELDALVWLLDGLS